MYLYKNIKCYDLSAFREHQHILIIHDPFSLFLTMLQLEKSCFVCIELDYCWRILLVSLIPILWYFISSSLFLCQSRAVLCAENKNQGALGNDNRIPTMVGSYFLPLCIHGNDEKLVGEEWWVGGRGTSAVAK